MKKRSANKDLEKYGINFLTAFMMLAFILMFFSISFYVLTKISMDMKKDINKENQDEYAPYNPPPEPRDGTYQSLQKQEAQEEEVRKNSDKAFDQMSQETERQLQDLKIKRERQQYQNIYY